MHEIPSVAKLVELLQSMPGIGPRSAERLVFHMLRLPTDRVRELASSIDELSRSVGFCQSCFHVTENDVCAICSDSARDNSMIMVVADPLDVIALEGTNNYKGIYHVLGGVLDPIRGIGPKEIRVSELTSRLDERVDRYEIEVILATNPSTEGETTAAYLKRVIEERYPNNVHVTRLARGLPVGGDLEFADPVTLTRSLDGRQAY